MHHFKFLLTIAIVFLMSAVSFYLIVNRLDPFSGGQLPLALFYLTFFFLCTSAFTLLGYGIRLIFYRKEMYFIHLNLAVRQGVLLALLALFLLLFQSYRVMTWWDSLLLVIILILLEFYFISRDRKW